MRRLALALALAVAACGPKAKPVVAPAVDSPSPAPAPSAPEIAPMASKVDGDTITLGFSPPTVGDKWTDEKTTSMDLTVHSQGHNIPVVGGEHSKESFEVLAVSGSTMSKAKITYEIDDKSQMVMGVENAPASKIAGKTYTLEGSPPTVTTDAGQAPGDEATEVQDSEKHFAQIDPMDRILVGKSFTKDQPVDLPIDEVTKAFEGQELTPTKFTLTFRGMDGDYAKFDLAMDATQQTPGGPMALSMTGRFVVDIKRNEPVSMELAGSVVLSGAATAEGTMTTTQTRTR